MDRKLKRFLEVPKGTVGLRYCISIRRVTWAAVTVNLFYTFIKKSFEIFSQLLAMDASARISMKDAAKCDKHCEWQNFENQ